MQAAFAVYASGLRRICERPSPYMRAAFAAVARVRDGAYFLLTHSLARVYRQ